MKFTLRLLFLLTLAHLCFGQGAHRISQILVKGNGIAANVGPFAKIKVCVVNTDCSMLSTVYADASLSVPLENPVTADGAGNYNYYVVSGCVDEFISSPGQGSITLFNICPFNGVGGLDGNVVLNPAGNQTILQPLNTSLNVLTSGTGALKSNGAPVVVTAPNGTQTITQPVNTPFNVITSGTGSLQSNGSPVIISAPSVQQAILQPINTNFAVTTSGSGQQTYNGSEVLNRESGVAQSPSGNQVITQNPGTSLNVNILNKSYNAAQFCTTPGTLDQSCVANAVVAANGNQVYVPAGTYSGTASNITQSNINLILDHAADLNYALSIVGQGYARSATVSSSGTYPVGTTTFSGNFTGYTAGQAVVIDQVTPSTMNQIGSEFDTVVSASGTNIVLATPTRFSYSSPNISKTSNALKASGNTPVNSFTVSGNFTSILSVGDLVRVDNTTGTDAVGGITGYFEVKKVASINTSAVTFEQVTHSIMGNPWLVKMTPASNIHISGGTIKNLTIANAEKVDVGDMSTGGFVSDLVYNFRYSDLRGSTSTDPAVFTLFWLWQGTISNLLGYGSVSTTDNGNVKLSGIQDVAVSTVSSWYGTATAQGTYPFMVDFNFTPYNIWNANDTFTTISAGSPHGGGASIFLGGLRNSTISGITGTSGVEFLDGDTVSSAAINAGGQLSFRSGAGYIVSGFYADSMSIGDDTAVTNSQFSNFFINGGPSAFFSRSVYMRATSNNIRFSHGNFDASANTTFYEDPGATNIAFDDITDAPTGGAASLTSSGNSNFITNNRFAGSLQGPFTPVSSPSIAPTTFSTPNATFVTNNPVITNASTVVSAIGTVNTSTGGHTWNAGSVGSSGMLGCTVGQYGLGDFTDFVAPACFSSGQAFFQVPVSIGGGSTISNSNLVPRVGTPAAGRSACIKSAGPPVALGFCSSAVDASGACTCN